MSVDKQKPFPVDYCRNDLELHGLTQCDWCGDLIHQEEASIFTYYEDGEQKDEHFCSETCHVARTQEWRINRGEYYGKR